ncbi:MAG: PKD domain-containing protein [Bauldia sp.]|nr:PKD domain-containing protein [Bauldia sp.]
MRPTITRLFSVLLPAVLAAAPALAQDRPLLITYGAVAAAAEGDPDHGQAIYLSLPASATGTHYVRIFDPDAVGAHDQLNGTPNAATVFRLFGGAGAYAADFAAPRALSTEERTFGEILGEREFRQEAELDGQWVTLTEVEPEDGDLVGERRIFRLLVVGTAGDDGNVFGVALTSDAAGTTPDAGVEMFSFSPTVRIPDRQTVTELRFQIPADAESLTGATFDGASGEFFFTTPFVSAPFRSSGQGNWREVELPVAAEQRGGLGAFTLAGGGERPNDVTVYVTDSGGALLPIVLPPNDLLPNRRPVAIATAGYGAVCTSARFSGLASTDADGNGLGYRWVFPDGSTAEGPSAEHDFGADGRYTARLEVLDDSGHLGAGAFTTVETLVKNPPVARTVVKPLVAVGEVVNFNGTGSSAGAFAIARHLWVFPNGTTSSDPIASFRFAAPGTYSIRHVVRDDSGHRCDLATENVTVVVNAQPVAVAGDDRRVAIGETTTLDGSASTDAEGPLASFRWTFGDRTGAETAVATHAYDKAGTYVAVLAVNDGSGVGNAAAFDTVTIIVNDPPVAAAGPDRRVAVGEVVGFNGFGSRDRDGSITRHEWDFGDGARGEGPTPEHAYAAPGLYTVRLTVTDDSGTSTAQHSDELMVRVNAPPVAVAGLDQAVAVGEAVAFDASASRDEDGAVTRYRWEFGDGTGTVGYLPMPAASHVYRAPGTYEARLFITDDSGVANATASDGLTVVVNDAPVANAGGNRVAAVDEQLAFSAEGSVDRDGRITRYQWEFGDGATASGLTTRYAYDAPGLYTVRLTVTDDSGTRSATASHEILVRVNEGPVAEAGADQRVAIGEETFFDGGASTDRDGILTAYVWDFGDGQSSSATRDHRASHAYARPGTYLARLTVTDNSGVGNASSNDTLRIIVNDPPIALIGPDRSSAIAETVAFSGLGSRDPDGTLIEYAWDFGDGASATGANVDHAYARSGTYTVRLTVTDDSTTGSAQAFDELSIRVNEPPVPEAGPDQLVTASLVAFDGGASTDPDGGTLTYRWDFGDGQSGDGPRPSHVYAATGTYDVALTVTDDSGTLNAAASDRLTLIVNAAPIADAGPDLVGAPGERLTFEGTRSIDPDGSIVSYDWDFRDGATASGELAEHAFERPGVYNVRLKVADDTGHPEAVDFAVARVTINDPPVPLAAAPARVAPGDIVRFDGRSSFDRDGAISSYRWDFSDQPQPVNGGAVERLFFAPGVYSVQLTVTDDSGASNATAKTELAIAVNHAPVADAGPDIDTGALAVSFSALASVDADGDALSYSWDFGDGATGVGAVVSHTYAVGGTYPVILTVDDGTELANATSRDAILVTVNQTPLAVAGESRRVCTGDIVLFDGSSSVDPEGGVLRYSWDFGDGTSAAIVNPSKTYNEAGSFPVTLTVRDDSGQANDMAIDRIAVRVDQGPLAEAGPDQRAYADEIVVFDGARSFDTDGFVNSFSWDFGDGSTGAGQQAAHAYARPGTYTVTLTIVGDEIGDCDPVSVDTASVEILAGPVATIASVEAAPVGDAVRFDGSGSTTTVGRITGWLWDFGDGVSASGETVDHRFDEAGVYTVTLTLQIDAPLLSARPVVARTSVTINAGPIADAGEDVLIAAGEQIFFDGMGSSDPDGGIVSYLWDFGDKATGTGMSARHRYDEPGTYTARLTVKDDSGLPNDTASDELTVTVNAPPVLAIDGPSVGCAGTSYGWSAAASTDADGEIASFGWVFGDGSVASGERATNTFNRTGRFEIALRGDDGRGLANSQSALTTLFHVNAPPVASAGADQLVCPGAPVEFDGGLSTDADGAISGFAWDFGDGQTGEGASVARSFATPGTYEVRLTVTDDAGSPCSTGTDSLTVVVNAPPVPAIDLPGEIWTGGANDAAILDGSRSADPDGQALSFDWLVGTRDRLVGERVRHAFTRAGDVPIELTVSDGTGLTCGTASITTTAPVLSRFAGQ